MAKSVKSVELVIHAGYVLSTVCDNGDREFKVLEKTSIVINKGCIIDILPIELAINQYNPKKEVLKSKHVIMPGLINAHAHAAMSLFKGLADDLPLMTWLQEHIWPAEAKWVNEEFVEDGLNIAMAEMLKSGTTCFNDMYFFPDVAAKAVDSAGMRAAMGLIVIDFPTVWAKDANDYLEKAEQVRESIEQYPNITATYAPHAPYTVSDNSIKQVINKSNEHDLPVHMHIHETEFEVTQNDERPVTRLKNLGLLSDKLIAVHVTQINDEETKWFADAGVSVVHCPESNLKLASGFCPADTLLKAGVNVALGTDGSASNNDLDMFGEMKTAALLAKGASKDAAALPAEKALEMATINGAKALGIDNITGSIEVGKQADLIAVDLNNIESNPIYRIISQLVYSTSREQVTDVWVAGDQLLENKRLVTLDEELLIEKAKKWRDKIKSNG